MKKYFLITLIASAWDEESKGQYVRDIPAIKEIPVGTPVNAIVYQRMAMQLATEGFCIDGPRPKWIAPSQIKHVEIVFETQLTKS